MSYGENPPNCTIYINNLNDKLKVPELKRNIYHYFSQYGNILDIYANKTRRGRGQAFVIYEDLSGATRAVRDSNGFEFFGKRMRVAYARTKSDLIAKIDGTWKPRPRRKGPDHRTMRMERERQLRKQRDRHRDRPHDRNDDRRSKRHNSGPTNRILFVENLPRECNTMMLAMLFQQYPGYQESRLIAGKPGIAFVEFGDSYQASTAKESLQSFKITPTHHMQISFARH